MEITKTPTFKLKEIPMYVHIMYIHTDNIYYDIYMYIHPNLSPGLVPIDFLMYYRVDNAYSMYY